MKKTEAIEKAKEFRSRADALLQDMKAQQYELITEGRMARAVGEEGEFKDCGEVIAQHTLSMRDLESCIMRQGMALKYIGNPDPYPVSKLTMEDIARDMWAAWGSVSLGVSEPFTVEESIPAWDEFCSKPENAKAVQGWLAAAATHPALHRVEPTSGGLKM